MNVPKQMIMLLTTLCFVRRGSNEDDLTIRATVIDMTTKSLTCTLMTGSSVELPDYITLVSSDRGTGDTYNVTVYPSIFSNSDVCTINGAVMLGLPSHTTRLTSEPHLELSVHNKHKFTCSILLNGVSLTVTIYNFQEIDNVEWKCSTLIGSGTQKHISFNDWSSDALPFELHEPTLKMVSDVGSSELILDCQMDSFSWYNVSLDYSTSQWSETSFWVRFTNESGQGLNIVYPYGDMKLGSVDFSGKMYPHMDATSWTRFNVSNDDTITLNDTCRGRNERNMQCFVPLPKKILMATDVSVELGTYGLNSARIDDLQTQMQSKNECTSSLFYIGNVQDLHWELGVIPKSVAHIDLGRYVKLGLLFSNTHDEPNKMEVDLSDISNVLFQLPRPQFTDQVKYWTIPITNKVMWRFGYNTFTDVRTNVTGHLNNTCVRTMSVEVATGARLLPDKTIIQSFYDEVFDGLITYNKFEMKMARVDTVIEGVALYTFPCGFGEIGDARKIVYISNGSCRKGWSCEDKGKLCVDKNYGHDLSSPFTVKTHASNNDDLLGLFQDTPLRESGVDVDDFTCAAINYICFSGGRAFRKRNLLFSDRHPGPDNLVDGVQIQYFFSDYLITSGERLPYYNMSAKHKLMREHLGMCWSSDVVNASTVRDWISQVKLKLNHVQTFNATEALQPSLNNDDNREVLKRPIYTDKSMTSVKHPYDWNSKLLYEPVGKLNVTALTVLIKQHARSFCSALNTPGNDAKCWYVPWSVVKNGHAELTLQPHGHCPCMDVPTSCKRLLRSQQHTVASFRLPQYVLSRPESDNTYLYCGTHGTVSRLYSLFELFKKQLCVGIGKDPLMLSLEDRFSLVKLLPLYMKPEFSRGNHINMTQMSCKRLKKCPARQLSTVLWLHSLNVSQLLKSPTAVDSGLLKHRVGFVQFDKDPDNGSERVQLCQIFHTIDYMRTPNLLDMGGLVNHSCSPISSMYHRSTKLARTISVSNNILSNYRAAWCSYAPLNIISQILDIPGEMRRVQSECFHSDYAAKAYRTRNNKIVCGVNYRSIYCPVAVAKIEIVVLSTSKMIRGACDTLGEVVITKSDLKFTLSCFRTERERRFIEAVIPHEYSRNLTDLRVTCSYSVPDHVKVRDPPINLSLSTNTKTYTADTIQLEHCHYLGDNERPWVDIQDHPEQAFVLVACHLPRSITNANLCSNSMYTNNSISIKAHTYYRNIILQRMLYSNTSIMCNTPNYNSGICNTMFPSINSSMCIKPKMSVDGNNEIMSIKLLDDDVLNLLFLNDPQYYVTFSCKVDGWATSENLSVGSLDGYIKRIIRKLEQVKEHRPIISLTNERNTVIITSRGIHAHSVGSTLNLHILSNVFTFNCVVVIVTVCVLIYFACNVKKIIHIRQRHQLKTCSCKL